LKPVATIVRTMDDDPYERPISAAHRRDLVTLWFGGLTLCYVVLSFCRLPLLFIGLPFWLPIGFVCYASIRGQFSLKALFLLLTLESVAIAVAGWAVSQSMRYP
jgi:hypothetical protein